MLTLKMILGWWAFGPLKSICDTYCWVSLFVYILHCMHSTLIYCGMWQLFRPLYNKFLSLFYLNVFQSFTHSKHALFKYCHWPYHNSRLASWFLDFRHCFHHVYLSRHFTKGMFHWASWSHAIHTLSQHRCTYTAEFSHKKFGTQHRNESGCDIANYENSGVWSIVTYVFIDLEHLHSPLSVIISKFVS